MKRGRIKTKIEMISFHIRIPKALNEKLRNIVEYKYRGDESSKNMLVTRAISAYIRKYYKELA